MKNERNSNKRTGTAKIRSDAKRRYQQSGDRTGDGGAVRRNDGKQSPVAGKVEQIGTTIRTGDIKPHINGVGTIELAEPDQFTGRETGGTDRGSDNGYDLSDSTEPVTRTRRTRKAQENPDSVAEDSIRQVAEPKKLRRGRKPKAASLDQGIFVGMISFALSTAYDLAALGFGKHWSLTDEETDVFSNSLDKALATLPEKYYAVIRANVEKVVPWCALAVTTIAITYPRVESTIRQQRSEKAERENLANGHWTNGTRPVQDASTFSSSNSEFPDKI